MLKKRKILFESQKKFDGCRNIRELPFDFYLPKYNMCIEFDGVHHFKPMNHWGGKENLIEVKRRDEIKNQYCKDNNIKLLRIKYDENIEEKLSNFFNI